MPALLPYSSTAAHPAKGSKGGSFIPHAAIVMSARWARAEEYSTDEALRVARFLGATDIAWHYLTRGPRLAVAARAQGLRVNCALPSNTRMVKSACMDVRTGKPTELHGIDGVYNPDTNSASFRNEVSDYLREAKETGCTSLQQDDPFFMYYRRDQGCYGDVSPAQVKMAVKNYYGWLHSAVRRTYGHQVPITYNKKFHATDESKSPLNELARYFTGAMAEVEENQNTPGRLYDTIHRINELRLHLPTVTTLISESILQNRRHIAAVYALGGHPIFPWDVFLRQGDRMYGDISDYTGYYQPVKEHPELFNGMGVMDTVINHAPERVSSRLGLKLTGDSSDLLVVLKGRRGSPEVLHLVNWRGARRTVTVRLPRAMAGGLKNFIMVVPNKAPVALPLKRQSEGIVEFDVPALDVWAIVALSEHVADRDGLASDPTRRDEHIASDMDSIQGLAQAAGSRSTEGRVRVQEAGYQRVE